MFTARYWVYMAMLAMLAILMSACSPGTRLSGASRTPATDAALPTAQVSEGSSPNSEQLGLLKSLKRQGAAPELGNQVWLNSPPLRLAELRGKVVVIDFWTFG
jgi:hypothetical protein